MFPQQLDAPQAFGIAQAMMDGFDRHYRLFRAESARAKRRFEQADWSGQQTAQRERIAFYDLRVTECVQRLETEFHAGQLPMPVWQQVKLHYIGLMVEHLQPELAETFFNSVTTKILHRTHFHNDFIFVRPAVSTEYLESRDPDDAPTYRAYYPGSLDALPQALQALVQQLQLQAPFEDLARDIAVLAARMRERLAGLTLRANFQIQVLSSLFYRNKGAYLVGKIITGYTELPLAIPIVHGAQGQLVLHAALFGEDDLHGLFSFARAYFMVDMAVPSAYVQFLHGLMPRKPRGEIYSALGLAKQGKTLFYREFLHHLKHSSDQFRIAPGIKGLVMLVFDLPSFPYVFKLIRDRFPAPKETTRAQVKAKYQLVKQHDRVGRMADTMEYSLVAFPRERFSDALLAELLAHAPEQIEVSDRDGDGQQEVIIRHLYIERRLVPLNLYLQECFDAGLEQPRARANMERCVIEYGNAIKDLVAANIFPGDMLWKNFGVTRGGKVVFYDYDEIEYLTDCHFRAIPPARTEEEEMSGEIWWRVGPHDVFPETFGPFLLGHPAVREVFLQHHADLLEPAFWQAHQARIQQGHMHDVFPYDPSRQLHAPALTS
ncbi:bifunctional isocitrate dehydrogenase kinase/phosphatase [Comamonas aquatica]|uniref:Isocitrate dehydrogenase kinase/phosphatase n=1 Tax=Comamonas aquatica DA1877 TaxID=1457173 RepID=A0A014MC97_9BURK|nr:bifunctional isocitrate dehydrogenase kinase/phosphatase [Comamonas aquatica]EXU79381.1 isocitrate dehydrogenase [Comamonas aquatica DA1877]MDH0200262.1 bifunctional isocitrate dehydrogenase kinase/phosphatase [Comamonas aquatica]MDH0494531.1 bifunctional isocitrate dehydrogenase kinase/phosphatase [Comamonas aquatica]MDH1445248.1 bifunctional isocitrate dehydrogenase kinase/phosphatase [Comamonas aquatica]MDH1674249.1 bifunctional isocitrate dehydrogenase kinase/phosphatase [Comamonas aqua